MTAGSLWPHAKSALVDRWQTLAGLADVEVLYRDPTVADAVNGALGLREAVWFEGVATGQLEVIELGTPVIANEELEAAFIVQVLGFDTADTAEVVEHRAAEILAACVDDIAGTPRVTPPDGWADVVVSLQGSVTWVAVPLAGPQAAARCRVQLKIEGSRC